MHTFVDEGFDAGVRGQLPFSRVVRLGGPSVAIEKSVLVWHHGSSCFKVAHGFFGLVFLPFLGVRGHL